MVFYALLISAGLLYFNQQAVEDWLKLRGYTPPAEIAAIADRSSMTPDARHLWYVNKPQIVEATEFSDHCPAAAEKTIILGCYRTGDNGIYVYRVTDERLDGVVEVTSAHEMLHAVYDRLSKDERSRVDGLLENYYTQTLSDQRIKDTIDAYKTSEPDALSNEMHSIFATEVADLPDELESYYRQYFSDRARVVALAERYQSEFTSRRTQVAVYDEQLAALKTQIDSGEQSLREGQAELESERERLNSLRARDPVAYNAAVDSYNNQVNGYNQLLARTRALITQYNDLVEQRNTVAFEERQLAQALSSQSLPTSE